MARGRRSGLEGRRRGAGRSGTIPGCAGPVGSRDHSARRTDSLDDMRLGRSGAVDADIQTASTRHGQHAGHPTGPKGACARVVDSGARRLAALAQRMGQRSDATAHSRVVRASAACVWTVAGSAPGATRSGSRVFITTDNIFATGPETITLSISTCPHSGIIIIINAATHENKLANVSSYLMQGFKEP